MQYGAFGERTVLSSSIEPPRLGLPGQIYTPNGWFVHNYFREYDPSTGRYLQSDPIGLSGGINPYAYVKGNPVRFIDPFGLTQCDVDVALDLAATSLDGKPLPAPKNPRLPTPFEPWQSPDPVIQEVDNELKGYSGESNFDRKSHNYVNTVINSKYYECLSDKDALDLFDLIVHEGIHRSLPFDSPLQPDPIRTDYVYQATGTMIADLKDRFLRGRQKCRCCRN
ncbi:MAG: RHS repeat-associated core domain-containing protein [Gammaproteobacteria bacterium]|nr:RHS repeat-associated core domain-containing protein [Gammaproteobacteria bacterium]